jgi:hypothetical protein
MLVGDKFGQAIATENTSGKFAQIWGEFAARLQ